MKSREIKYQNPIRSLFGVFIQDILSQHDRKFVDVIREKRQDVCSLESKLIAKKQRIFSEENKLDDLQNDYFNALDSHFNLWVDDPDSKEAESKKEFVLRYKNKIDEKRKLIDEYNLVLENYNSEFIQCTKEFVDIENKLSEKGLRKYFSGSSFDVLTCGGHIPSLRTLGLDERDIRYNKGSNNAKRLYDFVKKEFPDLKASSWIVCLACGQDKKDWSEQYLEDNFKILNDIFPDYSLEDMKTIWFDKKNYTSFGYTSDYDERKGLYDHETHQKYFREWLSKEQNWLASKYVINVHIATVNFSKGKWNPMENIAKSFVE